MDGAIDTYTAIIDYDKDSDAYYPVSYTHLAAAFVAAGYAKHAVAVTSSHFGSAEKQFRFPNQYANQRQPNK